MSAPVFPASSPYEAAASGRPAHFPAGAGLFSLLWAAFRQWRLQSRLRNLAAEMDPRIMRDMGVPDWLISESTAERQLSRLRDVDYLRW